jgi:hypothetical protein
VRSLARIASRRRAALAASLLLTSTTALYPQQPTQSAAVQPTVSATMLRVLAEAADVYRTGKPIFLVADYRYPHNVVRGFTSRAAASRVKADSGANYGVFGPYVTAEDSIAANAPKVTAIRITTKSSSDTQSVLHNVNPAGADALFFSMSAVDKFVLPYYEKTLGPLYARTLRQKILEGFNSGVFYRHCFSWICTEPPGPFTILQASPNPQY